MTIFLIIIGILTIIVSFFIRKEDLSEIDDFFTIDEELKILRYLFLTIGFLEVYIGFYLNIFHD